MVLHIQEHDRLLVNRKTLSILQITFTIIKKRLHLSGKGKKKSIQLTLIVKSVHQKFKRSIFLSRTGITLG